MKVETVLVIDTETTGVSSDREIIEISMLLIDYTPVFGPGWGGALHEFKGYEKSFSRHWTSLIKADFPINPRAEFVHGICDADLVDAPRLIEVADIIEVMLARAEYIAGHNIPFDMWMLERDLPNLPWETYRRLDTYSLQKQHGIDYGGGLPKCLSLGNVILPSGYVAHRALADAMLSAQLLEMLSEQTGLMFGGLTEPRL